MNAIREMIVERIRELRIELTNKNLSGNQKKMIESNIEAAYALLKVIDRES